jgi:hypothetical protein
MDSTVQIEGMSLEPDEIPSTAAEGREDHDDSAARVSSNELWLEHPPPLQL